MPDIADPNDIASPGTYGAETETTFPIPDVPPERAYPQISYEADDMGEFANQWDDIIVAFDPLYRALYEAREALKELRAFPWEGTAGHETRAVANLLRIAIDNLLREGQENGMADVLNTAWAQKSAWEDAAANTPTWLDKFETAIESWGKASFGLFAFTFAPVFIPGGWVGLAIFAAKETLFQLTEVDDFLYGQSGSFFPAIPS